MTARGPMPRSSIIGLMLALISSAAWAETITGQATVIDGDTLKIHGIKHRLQQIDAPEHDQTCRKEGVTWMCGAESAQHLRKLIRSRPVYCESNGKDPYGRYLSVCFVGKRNLNAEMVGSGYALAYRKYGSDYVEFEEHAKEKQLGLWAGTFVEPWRYRQMPRADEKAPEGCLIKGNINSKGRHLYHRPGDRSYANTRINTSKGERWFCSEKEAQQAGWTAAWTK